MAENLQYQEIMRRIDAVENRVADLEKEVSIQGRKDTEINAKLISLKEEFDRLRMDVLGTIKESTDKTWNLINGGVKIIIVLISVILAIVGIKVAPELLNLI